MKTKICRALLVIGMLMLFGTAGSSDLELISTARESVQIIIGLGLFAIGFIGGDITEVK